MSAEEFIEASEKCPLMQAKRAGQKRDRELVASGRRALESMFFIPPGIARTLVLKRRTDDF